ncbi:PPR domain-containing protein/PPR_2 domain-containing protein [Balamuthia mandrillaris]
MLLVRQAKTGVTRRGICGRGWPPLSVRAPLAFYRKRTRSDGRAITPLQTGLLVWARIFPARVHTRSPACTQTNSSLKTSLLAACGSLETKQLCALLDKEKQEKGHVVVDDWCFSRMTMACVKKMDLELGKRLLALWKEEVTHNRLHLRNKSPSVCGTQLIKVFTHHADLDAAFQVFAMVRSSLPTTPDSMIFGTMLGACLLCRKPEAGLSLWQEMKQSKLPLTSHNFGYLTRLCNATSHAQTIAEVVELLPSLPCSVDFDACAQLVTACHKASRNSSSSTTPAFPSSHTNNLLPQAMAVLHFMEKKAIQMQSGQIYCSLLAACTDQMALGIGRQVHHHIRQNLHHLPTKDQMNVQTAVINMYGKCGMIKEAIAEFDALYHSMGAALDVQAWTAAINAYGVNGFGKEALALFSKMLASPSHPKPNRQTFAVVLNACSHAGLSEEATKLFKAMPIEYGITPDVQHYNSMVDVLGRAGKLSEAQNLINTMARPDVVTWKTLLGACLWHKDIQRATEAAHNALKLDPKDAAVYVLLANCYATSGQHNLSRKIRARMQANKVHKIPGQSSIEIDGQLHSFLANDRSHPRTVEIYQELQKLGEEMEQAGFVPDTASVLLDVDEKMKEEHLNSHSEKLAIALGIISTPPGTPLLISKNLRVCKNCHAATALISQLRGREIVVRDANRFHHFHQGKCSCQNYW